MEEWLFVVSIINWVDYDGVETIGIYRTERSAALALARRLENIYDGELTLQHRKELNTLRKTHNTNHFDSDLWEDVSSYIHSARLR